MGIKINRLGDGGLGYLSGRAQLRYRCITFGSSLDSRPRVASGWVNDSACVASLRAGKADHPCTPKPLHASLVSWSRAAHNHACRSINPRDIGWWWWKCERITIGGNRSLAGAGDGAGIVPSHHCRCPAFIDHNFNKITWTGAKRNIYRPWGSKLCGFILVE